MVIVCLLKNLFKIKLKKYFNLSLKHRNILIFILFFTEVATETYKDETMSSRIFNELAADNFGLMSPLSREKATG